jgi:hypothetical protein
MMDPAHGYIVLEYPQGISQFGIVVALLKFALPLHPIAANGFEAWLLREAVSATFVTGVACVAL